MAVTARSGGGFGATDSRCFAGSGRHRTLRSRMEFFPAGLIVNFDVLMMLGTGAAAAAAAAAIAIALRPIRAARRAEQLARMQRDFHRQREQLEAKFIDRAAASGKPRGLVWTDVEFDDDVVYARERRSKRLKALVAIEVSFAAVEGGGMEHVEAVSNVRAATAEFLYDGSRWSTDGRVYFNLAPSAAVKYLSADLELVAEEHAAVRA